MPSSKLVADDYMGKGNKLTAIDSINKGIPKDEVTGTEISLVHIKIISSI